MENHCAVVSPISQAGLRRMISTAKRAAPV